MIHKSSIIASSAKIAEDVQIGPWSIIGENVEIGAGCKIASHVVIQGNTKIGKNNIFAAHCVIGGGAQSLGQVKLGNIIIGDNNIIREYVTINCGMVTDDIVGCTYVGNNNWLMAYAHIAHDCKLANNIVVANAVQLAGHVIVDDYVVISGAAAVHQHSHLGKHSFIGGRAAIVQDVVPYVLVAGAETSARGINLVGLKKRGFSREVMKVLKQVYRILFRSQKRLADALLELEELATKYHEVADIIKFIHNSKRGVVRPNVVKDSTIKNHVPEEA